MRVLDWVKRELVCCGLSEEELQQVKEPIAERNRKSVAIWSSFVSLFWILSLVLSLNSPDYASCRMVYVFALAICIISLVCALFFVKRVHRALAPVMQLFELSLLGAGIGIAVCQPDVRTVTMIAIAIIIPSCFIDRTITSIVQLAVAFIAYALLGNGIIVPEVYLWGLLNLFIFSVAGVLIGHVINKERFERYLYAESAKKLADIQANYNAELEAEVSAKTERITALHDQFVIGLATMVESRDNSTGGHIRRTSEGVRILVDAIRDDGSLHLTDEFCEMIVKAAPMHDLGKIAVDDSVLRKPGRYTPEEFAAMKTHAAEGARIIHEIMYDTDDVEFRHIAENIAHYHHERVDGTGYPEGLKGDEIPLEARIMAIADVYDALVSKRVYKERYSFEEADRIILGGMGTHFDADLKDSYEAARPALEAYYQEQDEN